MDVRETTTKRKNDNGFGFHGHLNPPDQVDRDGEEEYFGEDVKYANE